MATTDSPRAYELAVTDVTGALLVARIRGRERVSRPYTLDVDVLAEEAFAETSLVGRRAALRIHAGRGLPRILHGIVTRQALHGHPRGNDLYQTTLRLAATVSRLRLRTDSRIYQDLDVLKVVADVLGRARVPFRSVVQAPQRALEYCVQYRETDYAFVARLLAEHGLFYWFEQPDTGDLLEPAAVETMVIADHAAAYPALAPPGEEGPQHLAFNAESEGATDAPGDVQEFARADVLRANVATQKGFDFINPMVPYRETVSAGELGRAWPAQTLEVDLEDYQHHDEYLRTRVDHRTTRLLLAQHQNARLRATGRSARQDLSPARRFVLDDHPVPELNREYVVIEVSHHGVVPELAGRVGAPRARLERTYSNRFACGPADVEALSVPRRRSLQQMTETATVVGPAGEEVYTDEHGRVKVQFHWDRQGRMNERSSCWLRVAQAWAGAGFGAQFIPRIGMEVIVTFLEGDTDRPVVLGCLYNGSHGAPFDVPVDRTRSGLRTNSVGGAAGHNELSFEDGAGAEQVFLRAWRDHDEVVGNDHTAVVTRDETVRVGRDRALTVDGDRTDTTHGAAARAVDLDRTSRVGGNEATLVQGAAVREVRGASTTRVGRDAVEHVAGAALSEVAGDRAARVLGTETLAVGRSDAPRALVVHVEDQAVYSSAGTTVIRADKALELRVGQSIVRMTDARIELVSGEVSVAGKGARMLCADDAMKLHVAKTLQAVAQKVVLKSEGAGLQLDNDLAVDGANFRMKSEVSAQDEDKDTPPTLTRVELVDQNGRALAHHRYRLLLGEGREATGVLDAQGCAEFVVEGAVEIEFPEAGEVLPA